MCLQEGTIIGVGEFRVYLQGGTEMRIYKDVSVNLGCVYKEELTTLHDGCVIEFRVCLQGGTDNTP